MSPAYEKLKTLLSELFQLDRPDLDFGIYRIMHAKSAEVTQFLENDLLPQVEHAFDLYRDADKSQLEKELAKAVEQAQFLGADPETLPKVRDLRAKLASGTADVTGLEREVFDHLFSFFRRYYSEGDYFAKRVYKPGVYAIPYEGEEVTLYWATRDQYYIKTDEYLSNYTFRLRPDERQETMPVHFRLVKAAEGEHANIKADEDGARAFILAPPGDSGHDFIEERDGELFIDFEYRPATLHDIPEAERDGKAKRPAQKDLNASASRRVLAVRDSRLLSWVTLLGKPHVLANGDEAGYTRLEANLRRYTDRNTFDYFIHKRLGPFLRQELDFYIKNEVMHLDDVEDQTAPRVEQYISKIKVIRTIGSKVIDFLAQLEEFQKRLWLKKKFVVDTQYCITLDNVPEDFYADIAASKAQVDEWVKLYHIDEIAADLHTQGYSNPPTVAFLKGHPQLVVDTRHFDRSFTDRLVDGIADLDSHTDGLLFHCDNFHGLSLVSARYARGVDCIYIDPPYNAKSSEILYKNDYKHSSWLALMDDRLTIARQTLEPTGVFVSAIDEVEQERLGQLLSLHFATYAKDCIVVNSNPSGQQGDNFSFTHEYAYFVYATPGRHIAEQSRDADERNFRDVTGNESLRTANCFYPIYVRDGEVVGFGDISRPDYHPAVNEPCDDGTVAVYPVDPAGVERKWKFARDTVERIRNELKAHQLRRGIIDIKRTKNTFNYKSNWCDPRYSANNHGTQLLNQIIPKAPASYPKSIYTVHDCIHAALNGKRNGLVLDYFAGSGTTGHAVITLNRADGGHRKFILMEVGEHFDTVLVPRIKKITFAPKWNGGRPVFGTGEGAVAASPRIIKVIRLESYEDTLNNLEMHREEMQQTLLDAPDSTGRGALREQYLLRYMLDVESRGSQSLLNLQAFAQPTTYALRVKTPGADESRYVAVDLLETFNWLLGLTVERITAPRTFYATFARDSEKRLHLQGELVPSAAGAWWFRTVTGTTPEGRRTLIIWRNLPGDPEQDNLVLNEWTATNVGTATGNMDLIYVNGDNNLECLKRPDERWTVRIIERDFHRLMFDAEVS